MFESGYLVYIQYPALPYSYTVQYWRRITLALTRVNKLILTHTTKGCTFGLSYPSVFVFPDFKKGLPCELVRGGRKKNIKHLKKYTPKRVFLLYLFYYCMITGTEFCVV